MKPNFALGLTEDGITLWQRAEDGWLRVGAVAMDAADMDARMQALVAKATALAPEGIATKLVIPDEQILYTDIPAQADADAIRAALDGKTPYPVEELEFDWQPHGDGLRVAVVARETLAEAEDFARSQGLNPVCFVAAPQDQGFASEPFFGPVRGVQHSPDALGRGGPILRETGLADIVQPTPPKADKVPGPGEKADASRTKAGDAPGGADRAPTVAPVKAEKAKPDTTRSSKTASVTAASGTASPDKAKPEGRVAPPDPTPSRPTDAAAPVAARDGASDNSASVSFRSRRAAPGAAPSGPAGGPAPTTKTLTALTKSRSLSIGSLGGAALADRLRASVTGPAKRAGDGLRSATARLGRKPATDQMPAVKPKPPTQSAPARGPVAKPASKPVAGQPAKPAKTPPSGPRKPEADPEAERLTVFGARRGETQSAPALPRRALALSGAALLLVLAVVVWVFYFTRMSEPELAQPVLPEDAASEIMAPDALALPETTDLADAGAEAGEALDVTDAAQQQGIVDTQQTAPPEGAASDDAEVASVNRLEDAGRLASLRSVRAFAPSAPGNLPNVQPAPAPFGANPLPPLRGAAPPQVAQVDGTDAPVASLPPGEELLDIAVTQGRPNAVPPVRPEGIAPDPVPEPASAPVSDPGSEPLQPLDEDALVIDVTEGAPPVAPPDRPEGIAPDLPAAVAPEADAPDDQASLTPPPGGVALTLLTPRARPEEIVAQADAIAARFASATPQAVVASLRPSERPDGFSQTVQRALAAAPQAEIVQASAAAVAPRIPSSASVTRAATQTRAINLRQTNLLGVMGTPSARRALVRLDSGRVVTVSVGERLDGGQVTAIGDSELRYNKRGRDVVLRIAS